MCLIRGRIERCPHGGSLLNIVDPLTVGSLNSYFVWEKTTRDANEDPLILIIIAKENNLNVLLNDIFKNIDDF